MSQSTISQSGARARAFGCITARAGETLTITLDIDETDGTPESLSGDDLIWTLRRRGANRNAVKLSINGGEITVTDEANGQATITVAASKTERLLPGYYDQQLWLKDSNNAYEQIGSGLVHLLKQHVTDPPSQSEVLEFVV